jgi:hypothetical protein
MKKKKQLLTMNTLVFPSMKNAAKCDISCELQIIKRIIELLNANSTSRLLCRGFICLSVVFK